MSPRLKKTDKPVDLHTQDDSEALNVEELLFEAPPPKSQHAVNLPTIAGLGLLSAVVLYILNYFGLPAFDISNFFVIFPIIGLLLIFLVGLSPLRGWRMRRARKLEAKKRRKQFESAVASVNISEKEDSPFAPEKSRKPSWSFPVKSRKKYLAGVCGGIAKRINMDPTLFRALFLISLFATGAVPLVAYILCAIFMPSPDQNND